MGYDEEEGWKPPKKPRKKRVIPCKDYALGLISRQGHTVGLLKQKLERKGYPEADIKTVLKELKDLKFIDDSQYSESYFENLKKYRNFGFYGIKKKLMDKKVEKQYIDTLLKSLSIKEELEIAKRLINKSKNKTYEQKARMLRSRGFRGDVVGKAISRSDDSQ